MRFFLCSLLFAASSLLSAETDAQLLQATSRQTVLTFRLMGLKFDTLTIAAGPNSVIPKFSNSLSLAEAGAPNLPVRIFVLGVPEGATVEATAVPGAFEEIREVNVAPFPTAQVREGETGAAYLPRAEIYDRDAWYPADLVTVDPPAYLRQQRIVRVAVAPVQYNPVQKTLRWYRELRLVVRHAAPTAASETFNAAASAFASPVEESFYQGVIFNYEAARPWRAPRPGQTLSKISAPMAGGPFYKIAIRNEGIYRITGQALAGAGIDLASVQPAQIRIYNNGGRELPRSLTAPRPQGLIENAIYVADGNDGRFDLSDYILFYGRGVDGFTFDSTNGTAAHYLNKYGYENYYFLSLSPAADGSTGKRMATRTPLPVASATTIATSFVQYLFVEEEQNPLYESTQSWFGYNFSTRGNNTKTYKLQLPDPVTDATARMTFSFYAPYFSSIPHRLAVTFNQQPITEFIIPGNNSRRQSYTLERTGVLKNGENELLLTYTGSGEAANMYIDFFELSYPRQLRLPGPSLIFSGTPSAGPVAYRLENANPNGLWLFDISDFSNVTLLNSENWQVSGSQLTFADLATTPVPRRYVASTAAGFVNLEAQAIVKDAASNWRSPEHEADMIIITHADFLSQAQRLESLRENWQPGSATARLSVEVVNIQDVFDEFSCGLYDPVAIRDFLKYAYENWRKAPAYVLLFGDSDYDPKNLRNKSDKNWIPSYHTDELNIDDSRVTDAWFTYVRGTDAVMDLAIGRIPARTLAEAEAFVNKLIKYETDPVFGPWRNTLLMVADDENSPYGLEAFHINDMEDLINLRTPDYFDIRKLYLTEYPAVQSAAISGIRKPAATDAFLQLLRRGALIVNYAGHGNPTVWAHERLLEYASDFDRIQNGDLQAVWIAATCTFGQFDLIDRQSFGEQLLLVPGRGAIAVLATARQVYANANANLNQAYYGALFRSGQTSEALGTALVYARVQTRQTVNDEKFHLYGDPSMRLAIPRYSAQLTTPDTIKALARTTVRGTVLRNGQPWQEFNGTVRVEAFDSERFVTYRNGQNFSINYTLPGNSLFRGEARMTNGRFDLQFIAPKDLTYGGTRGRFSVYFWNDTTDGNGYRNNIAIGGTVANFTDNQGPEIKVGFQGVADFAPGGYVGPDPVLQVTLKDSISGINIAGDIGHKITLTLDGRNDNRIDVTDFFNYNPGDFTAGTLSYPLAGLAEGRHTVAVKAWDNSNNSNTATTEFVIAPADRLVLWAVMNYPNPFRNETQFTFEINQPAAQVKIKIYTLAGRLIRTLELPPAAVIAGFNRVEWDGRDQDGDEVANGVYLYKVIATHTGNGSSAAMNAEERGKLVVQR
ncbi:MAG: type IX secretion system sortase PorU [candidate division KSB1 bacterium]|nr:type IX secretion system sortase PorU [candidate division KSB1 bacterium]MDZ7274624.1 type IX secretion system sortase PorU [candidate division KSB1 bacterium]MDZ7285449.1 type IX secretion system sortase PorU [candidate division KSB1 bacterium]MDZ7298481.1 type IX secretion system sortase PorU [candidate division KSB1 bacterium]MDZ7306965.1 type IX secretion system sortase PorU [candidate division KSB1 bacterium]